jgi:pimeloyl-ACP methyl ester carboxylesterase
MTRTQTIPTESSPPHARRPAPPPRRMLVAAGLVVLAVAAALTGCAADNSTSVTRTPPSPEPSSSSPSPRADVMAEATIYRRFAIGKEGAEVQLQCFGAGGPTIVLEVGTDSSGLEDFPDTFVRPLAEQRMTCVYDRLGTGQSDKPSKPRRTIDDAVSVLHELLNDAAVPKPYGLVGSSGGGNIVAQYALRHSSDVAGLVLLDVPRPVADLGKEFPGPLAWKNIEHIDWPAAERQQTQLRMPVGDFPVMIVTAADGDSSKSDQAYWTDLSPRARQIVMQGGHNLYEEYPEEVAAEILSTLASH